MTKFQRAKRWRESHGLTQASLAKHLYLSPRAVCAFECGVQGNGRPMSDRAFRRYRLLCYAWWAKELGCPSPF